MSEPRYVAGDLVLIPFPAPGRETAALSPAIVLLSWPWGDRSTHYLLCLVDVHPSVDPYEVPLLASDIALGEIPQDLFIRPTYLMTVGENRIRTHIAKLLPWKLRDLIDDLADALYEDVEVDSA